ncbi:hypothetical protein BKA65DRAFT_595705 [Rhexocercosporidium sp. MPI-PUGE-AT-0058]|nr:hypothetical protein BKA65DRAFT_595705 [Rhexocercosporidium sp. MPI-PUGE-AT-0058]
MDFDLDRDLAPPPRRSKMSKGFFSFENPGFVLGMSSPSFFLFLYNFLLALPLAYILTSLSKSIISSIGYEKIMRCPSGILFSRLLFVALNMWLLVGWGLQLEKEARDRKEKRLEAVRSDVAWWEGEVERLEGVLGGVRQQELEEQLLRESPTAGSKNTMFYSALNRNGSLSPVAGSAIGRHGAEEVDEVGDDEEDSQSNEESVEGGDSDSDWNGVD